MLLDEVKVVEVVVLVNKRTIGVRHVSFFINGCHHYVFFVNYLVENDMSTLCRSHLNDNITHPSHGHVIPLY